MYCKVFLLFCPALVSLVQWSTHRKELLTVEETFIYSNRSPSRGKKCNTQSSNLCHFMKTIITEVTVLTSTILSKIYQ